jgi:hnRNP-L/PTB/hephaestus splicing factor
MTIWNPLFPIDVDILHKILSPYGTISRIVIFRKSNLHALCEFENPEACAAAQRALDGKDIYDNCCTLKVDFSRNNRLNVRVNNDLSRDFTNPDLPTTSGAPARFEPRGGDRFDARTPPSGPGGFASPHPREPRGGYGVPAPSFSGFGAADPYARPTGPGCVVVVYNLPEFATVDNLFNLFSLYAPSMR